MRRLVLASHGSFAEGMKSAAVMILGETADSIETFGLDAWETPQAVAEEIEKLMAQAPDDEYVLLCDIKGGSVHNALIKFCTEPNVSVISGINLNLVLELAMMDPGTVLADKIEGVIETCCQGMQFLNTSVMEKLKEKEKGDELW